MRWNQPILEQYLFGKSNLYVLTEVVSSPAINVSADDEHKRSLALDVPAIQQIVGGRLGLGSEGSSMANVSYKGERSLAFGLVADELSASDSNYDGELDRVSRPVKPGGIAPSVSAPAVQPKVFEGPLADLRDQPLAQG